MTGDGACLTAPQDTHTDTNSRTQWLGSAGREWVMCERMRLETFNA